MGFFSSINISASALTAEQLRMDIIAENIANANVTRTPDGTPYRRKMPVFRSQSVNGFDFFLSRAQGSNRLMKGVEVAAVVEDQSDFKKIYNPTHPDADSDGYVRMPNVEVVNEMINLISASRAYESNITAINTAKQMAMKAIGIGR